jgi:hypothetical protein
MMPDAWRSRHDASADLREPQLRGGISRGPVIESRCISCHIKDSFPWPASHATPHVLAMAPRKTVVIGAGPVGALAALYAANRGDEVVVYELRSGKPMLDLISVSQGLMNDVRPP